MWDIFISYATEDRVTFVEGLAQELKQRQVKVWYDRFELRPGDSLTRSIDEGLTKSNFGVVVLSPAFFSKEWPRKELDALVTREDDGRKVILPVWLNITRSQVAQFSALLCDRIAAKASEGPSVVADEICQILFPSDSFGSTQKLPSSTPQLKGKLSCLIKHTTETFPLSPNLWSCPGIDPRYSCLVVRYPYDDVKRFPDDAYSGIERFLPLLPMVSVVTTLNEGNTPLLHQSRLNKVLGTSELYLVSIQKR